MSAIRPPGGADGINSPTNDKVEKKPLTNIEKKASAVGAKSLSQSTQDTQPKLDGHHYSDDTHNVKEKGIPLPGQNPNVSAKDSPPVEFKEVELPIFSFGDFYLNPVDNFLLMNLMLNKYLTIENNLDYFVRLILYQVGNNLLFFVHHSFPCPSPSLSLLRLGLSAYSENTVQ